jgi:hypothetical protein
MFLFGTLPKLVLGLHNSTFMKFSKLHIALGHLKKETLMLNGMFIPCSNDL